jgi:hypothetical protein
VVGVYLLREKFITALFKSGVAHARFLYKAAMRNDEKSNRMNQSIDCLDLMQHKAQPTCTVAEANNNNNKE